MTKERLKSYLVGISHTVSKEMAGSSHTPACCLSKLRSSLEAGKKQPRVWLQYSCGVVEGFLCFSFGVPLVLLWSPFDDSYFSNKRVQRTFVSNILGGREIRSTISRLFQKGFKNEVKMVRNRFKEARSDAFRQT